MSLSLSMDHLYKNKMANFDNKRGKLEGTSGNESGGLMLPTKRPKSEKDDVFKKPTTSLLGLDSLAREKRKERQMKEVESLEQKRKVPKIDESQRTYGDGQIRVSFGSGNTKSRHYR